MRTTLRLEDDILAAARSLARSQRKPLGEVVSDLARRGLQPRSERGSRRGFPTFSVSRKARALTAEDVRRALENP